MKKSEVNRFNEFYERHLRLLKLQGKSQKTIDAYFRSVRRIRDYFDCCPDKLTLDQLEAYFVRKKEKKGTSLNISTKPTGKRDVLKYLNNLFQQAVAIMPDNRFTPLDRVP